MEFLCTNEIRLHHMEILYAEQSIEQFVVVHRRSPFDSDGSTSFLLFPLITGEPCFSNGNFTFQSSDYACFSPLNPPEPLRTVTTRPLPLPSRTVPPAARCPSPAGIPSHSLCLGKC